MAKRMSRREMRQYISERSEEDPETGCWNWTKSLDVRGYGQAWDNKRVVKAHRLSYEAFNGDLEEWIDFKSSKVVMHKCHNPACVNPYHLRAGTQRENIEMSMRDKRYGRFLGEQTHNSSLANGQVVFARNLYRTGAFDHNELACMLGVKSNVVQDFMTRTYQI